MFALLALLALFALLALLALPALVALLVLLDLLALRCVACVLACLHACVLAEHGGRCGALNRLSRRLTNRHDEANWKRRLRSLRVFAMFEEPRKLKKATSFTKSLRNT